TAAAGVTFSMIVADQLNQAFVLSRSWTLSTLSPSSLQSHTSNFFQRGFAQKDLSQPVLKQGFHSARHSCGADCGSVLTFHDHVAYVGVNLEQLKDTHARPLNPVPFKIGILDVSLNFKGEARQ